MGNNVGTISRPKAIATIRKNGTATIMQSKLVIPFYKYFVRGDASPSIQPAKPWLTRG